VRVSLTTTEHREAGRAEVTGLTVFPGRWLLGAFSVLVALALWVRMRQLGCVAGHPHPAATPALRPFVEQTTVLLTTYRKNGRPVPTPVSIAVDGDRAVVRSFEKAGKTRRLRNVASVAVAPCSWRGTPTGPAIRATARILDGGESRRAAFLLRRKYPLLHGFVVPLVHRVGRSRTGRTVHFELSPEGVS
jgi:PPOX class probable F420-dependent enzyme